MFKRECDSLFLVKVLFVLAIGLLTMSCGTTRMYSGPELRANEIAIIQSATSAITIESCDRKRISASRVAVLPGEHLIEMSFYDRTQGDWVSWSISNSFLSFTAEAGHTYSVDWKDDSRDNRKYVVVLKDLKTGEEIPYKQGAARTALRGAYVTVIATEASRLIVHHSIRSIIVKEEYDTSGIDISSIKIGDNVYIEYLDGKPRILKSINRQE
jgi:hypothetical protein